MLYYLTDKRLDDACRFVSADCDVAVWDVPVEALVEVVDDELGHAAELLARGVAALALVSVDVREVDEIDVVAVGGGVVAEAAVVAGDGVHGIEHDDGAAGVDGVAEAVLDGTPNELLVILRDAGVAVIIGADAVEFDADLVGRDGVVVEGVVVDEGRLAARRRALENKEGRHLV